MPKVAVIEDDVPTSNQLRGWIEAARPGIEVHQWFSRDDAESALAREHYDVVVLDTVSYTHLTLPTKRIV